MKKRIYNLALLLLSFAWCAAQNDSASAPQTGVDSVIHRIFLVGDAGELHGDTHPVVEWLRKHADWNDPNNTVIYLGDNIYPLGLPPEGEASYAISKKIIDYQIDLVRGKKG